MNTPDKIIRATGVTLAERYLKKLCDHSFLSMWSYAGVFNDKGTGQEVCDLLVVFGNHIIIFSDKDCEFPNTGDTELDWKRWYKKAIKKSADQAYGAERWIKNYPNRLYLDQTCKIPFPINLPSPDEMKVHRIVVAHSASAKCKEVFGGSGSLMIDTSVVGDAKQFTIGHVETSKEFVHVFDDTTLDILLNVLDTISDFVAYLEKKERFFSKGITIFSTGEEELLADYLKNLNGDGEHDFAIPKNISESDILILDDEGSWQEFSRNPQRLAQIAANEISYSWDALIETFAKYMLEGTSPHYHGIKSNLSEKEIILRFMASENRTKRRFLARLLLEFIGKTPKNQKATRIVKANSPDEPFYVFLLFPYEKYMKYEDYRRVRGELLEDHLLITKLKFPEAKHIIGIATESGRGTAGSEDAAYMDVSQWTDEFQETALKTEAELKRMGLLGDGIEIRRNEKEYPYDKNQIKDFQNLKGRAKNLPCPCGSGRKYKKCCGN